MAGSNEKDGPACRTHPNPEIARWADRVAQRLYCSWEQDASVVRQMVRDAHAPWRPMAPLAFRAWERMPPNEWTCVHTSPCLRVEVLRGLLPAADTIDESTFDVPLVLAHRAESGSEPDSSLQLRIARTRGSNASTKGLRVGIVGGGWCSASLIAHILTSTQGRARIRVWGDTPVIGLGAAYACDDDLRLNVPADRMALVGWEGDAFVRWLTARGQGTHGWARRRDYGDFVIASLNEHLARYPGCVSYHVQRVVDARRNENGSWRVSTRIRAEENVDALVVATGNPPPRFPPALLPWRDDPRVIVAPLVGDWVCRLADDDHLVVVGTGLTALDVVKRLRAAPARVMTTCVSRTGRWPRPHLATTDSRDTLHVELPLRWRGIDDLADWLLATVDTHADNGTPWQTVVDAVRVHVPAIWNELDASQRRRFLSTWRRRWDEVRHRAPHDDIQALRAAHRRGELQTLPGNVVQVDDSQERLAISVQSGAGVVTVHASHVAVCTGPEEDVLRCEDPLLMALLRRGHVRPDAAGVGVDVDEAYRARQVNTEAPGPWIVGHLARGRSWEATSVPDLRAQVALVCRGLAAHDPAPRRETDPR